MARIAEKQSSASTRQRPRCARCHRPIQPGHEHEVDGRLYGSECVDKVIDALNRASPDAQERFL